MDYPAAANVSPIQDAFTIKIKFTPNWSGAPASQQHIFCMSDADSSLNNLVALYVATDGKISCQILTSAGAGGSTMSYDYPWVAGQPVEIHVQQNASNDRRMFVNKHLVFLNATAIARTANLGLLRVGTNYNHAATSNFKINYAEVKTVASAPAAQENEHFLTTKIYGLESLEGESLQVMIDGQYLGEKVVVGGEIDVGQDNILETSGFVGYRYLSRLETMALQMGSILGSANGQIKRVEEITIELERTVGCRYGAGQNEENEPLVDLEFRENEYTNDIPIPLFTGSKSVKFPSGYDRDKTIVVESDFPGPCNVTAITSRGLTYD